MTNPDTGGSISIPNGIDSTEDGKGLRASRWISSRPVHSAFAAIARNDPLRIELGPTDRLSCRPWV